MPKQRNMRQKLLKEPLSLFCVVFLGMGPALTSTLPLKKKGFNYVLGGQCLDSWHILHWLILLLLIIIYVYWLLLIWSCETHKNFLFQHTIYLWMHLSLYILLCFPVLPLTRTYPSPGNLLPILVKYIFMKSFYTYA